MRDLCLGVPSGCIYGLIGPNGSGKTAAIKVLMGLVRATSGMAEVLGRTVPVTMAMRALPIALMRRRRARQLTKLTRIIFYHF
ncbi:MAG TPA: ATP-binding cassette domain-containing protein [Methanomassiliicoccales archaeon]|nr:ATP-binding cassette domain-containing protein [Methanomassiliicoccales archaeon]